ncbi:putative F-box domain-containing protein [Tanacetum coccineum]
MHNRHLDRHQNPDKLLIVSGTLPRKFGTFDCEAPDSGFVPSRFRRPFDAKGKSIEFVTSFHGLVCVGIVMNHTHDKYSDLILWNPLTRDYKTLSKTNSHKDCYDRHWRTSGLFYSSCEDDYKLVRVINQNIFIYSLKSDSWRRVISSLHESISLDTRSQSICLNGNLYFKSYRIKLSITRFDTNTEKFEEIEGPRDYDIYDAWCATLMVQGGCLHFCVMIDGARTGLKETRIHLWRMVEDGCWNRVVSYGVDPNPYDICSFSSLYLMRNDKLLMLDVKHRTLYEVDLKKMQNSEGKEKWCNVVRMDISDQVRYTETFVSPNLYIK